MYNHFYQKNDFPFLNLSFVARKFNLSRQSVSAHLSGKHFNLSCHRFFCSLYDLLEKNRRLLNEK